MTPKKAGGGPASRKPPSYGRIKAHVQRTGAEGPSTLPPPPFQSEVEARGLEWWLDAHMNLASGLVWLEQNSGDTPEGPPSSRSRAREEGHLETIRNLAAHSSAVRDALYELYCDATDERLLGLVSAGAPLEGYVRASYGWCERVVVLLSRTLSDLRSPSGPDWTAAKATFREVANAYPTSGEALRAAVATLPIDFTSPVEPLRLFPRDLDQLLSSAAKLQATLEKHFA